MQYGVNPKLATLVHQDHLAKCVGELFPNVETRINCKDIFKSHYGTPVEFDVWIPSLSLCFEFQDSYHYVTTWYNQKSIGEIKLFDLGKQKVAKDNKCTLVEVPCWWDGTADSLASTIMFQRPDITFSVSDHSSPIPLASPSNFFLSPELPDIGGELMLASFPTDRHFEVATNTWWIGEKYDGIRCFWNNKRGELYSRSGRQIPYPDSLYNRLPKISIDGEFWFGRGNFGSACLLVTGSPSLLDSHFLRLIAFDVPLYKYSRMEYEDRYKFLLRAVGPTHQYTIVAPRMEAETNLQTNFMIHNIVNSDGEGVILHRQRTPYLHGRTNSLLKLKTTKGDSEGVVIAIEEDNSVRLKLPNDKEFLVPASHVQIPTPDIGSVVSFFYETFSRRDAPTHPQIFRVRNDLSWSDLVTNSESKTDYRLTDNTKIPGITPANTVAVIGEQSSVRSIRLFMEDFARSRNLDPLVPDTWYSIPYKDFYHFKGARAVLQKFRGGYFQAVLHLFPDIGLDAEVFQRILWSNVENRRKFFELYAKRHGFDPLLPENWYTTSRSSVVATKGAQRVIYYHQYSVKQALVDLFPNIGLDKSKFQAHFWFVNSRVRFFENFAKDHGFDPHVADNWYQVSLDALFKTKGINKVLHYHGGNITKALKDLFPKLGIERSKFRTWAVYTSVDKRKRFFEDYAKANNFDPLIAENWYSQRRSHIMASRGSYRVAFYHGGSLGMALNELFPELDLDINKFNMRTSLWANAERRRRFFKDFAERHKFDVEDVEVWYTIPREAIISSKGSSKVPLYHGLSLGNALVELFPNLNIDPDKLFLSDAKIAKTRRFFENYAHIYNFELRQPHNWYNQPLRRLIEFPGASDVINSYGSIIRAIVYVFHELGLEKAKFNLTLSKEDLQTFREFFEKYAHEQQFDPLKASFWYQQHATRVLTSEGAADVMMFFDNKLSKAIAACFPEIGIDLSKFQLQHVYRDAKMRRRFFEEYAKDTGFDPLEPTLWYTQDFTSILKRVGAKKVLHFHRNNIPKALAELFPDIGISRQGFQFKTVCRDPNVRIKFFENYAKSKGFDAYNPENWYKQSRNVVMSTPGAGSVLYYHGSSLTQALLDLFPNIGLSASKFPHKRVDIKQSNPLSRRRFFENYAAEYGFDPLTPENWYLQPLPRIMAHKGASRVVLKHGGLVKGLLDLFPEIGLEKSRFFTSKKS